MVTPNQTIMTVVDLTKNFINVSLDQETILLITRSQKTEMSFENIRNIKIKGHVDKVYPSNGDFIARISSKELPSNVLPGMTCDVAIMVKKRTNILLIPMSAIQKGRVKIMRNNENEWVKVEIGIINKKWGEVLNDTIHSTDRILIQQPYDF